MAETELTRPARALVCQARRLSARLGHGYVGSEHLLLALSTPEGGMAQRILIGAGLTDQAVESALVLLVGRGSPEKAPCQGLTPACRRCIGRAAMEALGRGRPGVEPEHLLLGVLGEGDCMAARVLSGLGMDGPTLYRQAVASLGEGGTSMPFRPRGRESEPSRESRL